MIHKHWVTVVPVMNARASEPWWLAHLNAFASSRIQSYWKKFPQRRVYQSDHNDQLHYLLQHSPLHPLHRWMGPIANSLPVY